MVNHRQHILDIEKLDQKCVKTKKIYTAYSLATHGMMIGLPTGLKTLTTKLDS